MRYYQLFIRLIVHYLLPSAFSSYMFHVKHYIYNLFHSISIFISHILLPHLPISYYIPSSPPINPLPIRPSHPSMYSTYLYQIRFNSFSILIYHHPPHFHTLQSFSLIITSYIISRHNTYHHTTYPYRLT